MIKLEPIVHYVIKLIKNMNFKTIKNELKKKPIFFSEEKLINELTVIGYEKKFKWSWFATQLNTFIFVSDYQDILITEKIVEEHLSEAFKYAQKNYSGWPRGLQSGIGVISILVSSNISTEAKDYCTKLKTGKKFAGFSIPVVVDSAQNKAYYFENIPYWGKIYYPHFRELIKKLT